MAKQDNLEGKAEGKTVKARRINVTVQDYIQLKSFDFVVEGDILNIKGRDPELLIFKGSGKNLMIQKRKK